MTNGVTEDHRRFLMQILEDEIKGKIQRVRRAGVRTELLLKLPNELRDTLSLKAGDRVQTYFNHKGEVFFRPVPEAVAE